MNSILYGIKRFIKNKNTVTIFLVLVSMGLLYWAYNYRIKKATEPVQVPYALTEIGPRTQITSDMVGIKKVPGGIVTKDVLMSSSLIIGKYVSNKTVIPENSLFYSSEVVEWEDLPSSIYGDIPAGNTIVALSVTLDTTFGNSIYPGNYIDLYYYGTDTTKGNKLMLGKLIESIEVLDVTDSSGNSVFETNEEPLTPAYLIFSVDEEMHLLLKKATILSGTIFPVQRNSNYSDNPEKTRVSSSYIKKYILDQTMNVEEDLSNPLYKDETGTIMKLDDIYKNSSTTSSSKGGAN